MTSALRVTALHKRFGPTVAVSGVSFELKKGLTLAVLGPSGCGKTTLLRCIAGFEVPDAGTIEIEGRVVNGRLASGQDVWIPPERRRVGYVPQEGALFPHLSVAQNVAFGLPRKARSSGKVSEVLGLVGMQGMERRMPHELSGGQQQRVALARALAPNPSLILLDEPFNALDAHLRATMREDIRQSLKRAGATSIIVTHDQEEALSMADVVSVIRDGELIQMSDPATAYRYPADLAAAQWIGAGVVLPAEVRNGCAQCILGTLPIDKRCSFVDGKATVMIRPEQVVIGEPEDGVPAQVATISFFGHDSLVRLRVDSLPPDCEVLARVLGRGKFAERETVGLKVEGDVVVYPAK